ncbi:transcription factor Opi1-domain-containing protein [Cokeromyces recurvatus]|uniref:transcription factor Opi1-domain-containing protein n=1 Tax=Cokeromyces recurvatus TaxID=90255 RepID=UPI00221E502D|nr:transcription factor Opi1-domain-containing protein [Cokeromyces recurvatus]KAI7905802.1 transcription factor Opi1-domain-containing protein [Cokeromyces recurvatus]
MTQQRQTSPMSITQLVHNNDIEDPDVKLAAEVLGDMARLKHKNVINLPPISTPSTTPSSPLPTPTTSSMNEQRLSFSSDSTMNEDSQQRQSSNFIHRVSNIPIVNSALKAYENSKNSSSVMKYGAEMVESFAAPIYDKFGKHALSGVDEWGCKQLDRLGEKYPHYVNPKEEMKKEDMDTEEDEDDDDARSATFALSRATLVDDNIEGGIRRRRENEEYKARSRNASRSTSPHRPHGITKAMPYRYRQQPLVRSKWHQIVMHASSAAGTTAAVISEESMKCLKYCLSWLQYASQHIDQQMTLLRDFLVSLTSNTTKEVTTYDNNPSSTLTKIKKEIVDTLRKVVDVISKYAGTGLPEQAKAAVRGFILALPTRWAILNNSTTSSNTTSPSTSPSIKPVNTNVQETSIKLLNFGGESIEMIHSVSNVFSDTIERAELWLERLRVVGVAGHRVSSTQPQQMDLN